MNALLQTALDYAAAGTPVFPCLPGTKVPATPNGFHDASTDAAVIRGWWTEEPTYNVALSPEAAGWAVVDVDGAAGLAAWAASEGGPETFTVRTPSGGLHLYYTGSVAGSTSKIADHVDTRGRGSYVLVPPSVIDERDAKARHDPSRRGVYTIIDDRDLADLPKWVEEAAGRQREIAAGSGIEPDLPRNVARATDFLKRRAPAIEGQGGDAWTLETAYFCRDLGCSPEKTAALMIEHWNARCEPPWDADELAVKITNAFTYAQNEGGAWAVAPAASVFGPVLDKLGYEWQREPPVPKRARFASMSAIELSLLPPIEWLVPQMIPNKSIGMLYGPPDSYKTFAVLTFAIDLSRKHDVIIVAGEGGRGLWPRINAWCILHDVDPASLRLRIVTDMPEAESEADVMAFHTQMVKEGWNPVLVVIDTAARMMAGLDESSAKDAGKFIKAMDWLKEAFDCTILAIHHTGKDAARGARGSSALNGGFDFVLEGEAHADTSALALSVRKMKDAERRREPWTFELRPLVGSLVLVETTAEQHRKLTQKEAGSNDPAKVGGALVALGALDMETAVVTYTLAHKLNPILPNEAAEDHHARVTREARTLSAMSRGGGLQHYCEKVGAELRWRIPKLG